MLRFKHDPLKTLVLLNSSDMIHSKSLYQKNRNDLEWQIEGLVCIAFKFSRNNLEDLCWEIRGIKRGSWEWNNRFKSEDENDSSKYIGPID